MLSENENCKEIKLVKQIKCESKEHLKSFLNEVVKRNGEGVMLRQPMSQYTKGRSPSLLRFKVTDDNRPTLLIIIRNI